MEERDDTVGGTAVSASADVGPGSASQQGRGGARSYSWAGVKMGRCGDWKEGVWVQEWRSRPARALGRCAKRKAEAFGGIRLAGLIGQRGKERALCFLFSKPQIHFRNSSEAI